MPGLALEGQYFEDIAVGQGFTTPGRTVTEADIVMFAGLSGDYNQIHTNEEFGRQTMFGSRIAHGLLGLSIASGLAARLGFLEGTVIAFLGLEWKFREPIRAGDTIHVVGSVVERKAMARLGGGIVDFDLEVLNQNGAVAQKGSWRLLIRSKP